MLFLYWVDVDVDVKGVFAGSSKSRFGMGDGIEPITWLDTNTLTLKHFLCTTSSSAQPAHYMVPTVLWAAKNTSSRDANLVINFQGHEAGWIERLQRADSREHTRLGFQLWTISLGSLFSHYLLNSWNNLSWKMLENHWPQCCIEIEIHKCITSAFPPGSWWWPDRRSLQLTTAPFSGCTQRSSRLKNHLIAILMDAVVLFQFSLLSVPSLFFPGLTISLVSPFPPRYRPNVSLCLCLLGLRFCHSSQPGLSSDMSGFHCLDLWRLKSCHTHWRYSDGSHATSASRRCLGLPSWKGNWRRGHQRE